ncbi:MAG: hypothetical protein ABI680_10135 [Chthoniobacteraceae bacterium]
MTQSLLAISTFFGLLTGPAQAVSYTYMGSWNVGAGQYWRTNPTVFTGQDAAAFLFGGSPSNYVISTVSDRVDDINFRTWLDGFGDSTTYGPGSAGAPQDFKVDSGEPGYSMPFGGPSYSAFVRDHFYNYYTGAPKAGAVNYAFLINDNPNGGTGTIVPEGGATLSLLGCALIGLTLLKHKFLSSGAVPVSSRR